MKHAFRKAERESKFFQRNVSPVVDISEEVGGGHCQEKVK